MVEKREDSEYASGYYENAEQEQNYLGGRERSSVNEDKESIKRAEQYKR